MKFKACEKCKYRKNSYGFCYDVCGLPVDILEIVEEYFNNNNYPEDLEDNLSNIVESVGYRYE